jgi:hypothetical protein
MKRSTLAKLIAPMLSQRNTGHYSYDALDHAHFIIKQLEELNLLRPTHQKIVIRRDLELIPYEDTIIVEGWEDE